MTGYSESWTREVFKIVEVLPTYPYTYILEDLKGERLIGSLYSQELTLADPELSVQEEP